MNVATSEPLLLCPLTPLLDKNHTQWVTEVFIQCVPKDNARREGRPVQSKQGAGKRKGRGAREKGWNLSTYLKGSRLEQAHEIRPNCLGYNYDYWL